MNSEFQERGCRIIIQMAKDGLSTNVSVYRLDDASKGDTRNIELFNPYAFFGYDYEDSCKIDDTIDEFLDRYGDPEKEEKEFNLVYRSRIF